MGRQSAEAQQSQVPRRWLPAPSHLGPCQAVSAGSLNSSAATGAATTSRILWTPAASLQTVTGYRVSTSGALSIDAYPTSGFVNFNVCGGAQGLLHLERSR